MSSTWELTAGRPPRQTGERAAGRSLRRISLLAGLAALGVITGVTVGVAVSRDDAVLPDTPAADAPAAAPAEPVAAPRRVDAPMVADTAAAAGPAHPETIAMSKSVAAPPVLPTGSSRFEVISATEDGAADDAAPAEAASNQDPERIELVVDGKTVNPLMREDDKAQIETASAYAEDTPVAETDAETRAMESEMAAEGAKEFVAPEPQTEVASAPKPAVARSASTSGMASAVAAKAVNMRSGPTNGAGVVAIVPAGARIMAQGDCKYWCRTVYDGKSGYIYKSFIRR